MTTHEQYEEKINRLIDKAEKSRQAHFSLARAYRSRAGFLHGCILIGCALTAILTFADYKYFLPLLPNLTAEKLSLSVGILATFIFILTVLEEYVKWNLTALNHEDAGKRLTSFIRTADDIVKKVNIEELDCAMITGSYKLINEVSPSIPDKWFIKAKREFLQKVELSRALDTNPYLSDKEFKKKRKKELDG